MVVSTVETVTFYLLFITLVIVAKPCVLCITDKSSCPLSYQIARLSALFYGIIIIDKTVEGTKKQISIFSFRIRLLGRCCLIFSNDRGRKRRNPLVNSLFMSQWRIDIFIIAGRILIIFQRVSREKSTYLRSITTNALQYGFNKKWFRHYHKYTHINSVETLSR